MTEEEKKTIEYLNGYKYQNEVSTYERKYIKNNKTEYIYRLEAIRPKEVIAKA